MLPGGFSSPHPDIRCLLQSSAADPNLPHGQPPRGLLSPAEQSRFETSIIASRRSAWLLGRWTAKNLVQSYLADQSTPVSLDRFEIDAGPGGAPYASLVEDGRARRLDMCLSISHSGAWSFCAMTATPGAVVGADVEIIEARDTALVRRYFASNEAAAVQAMEGHGRSAERDALVTLIWSAKEAVLKALQQGLHVDPRRIQCFPDLRFARVPGWRSIPVLIDAGVTDRDLVPSVWWLTHESHVSTLAFLSPS